MGQRAGRAVLALAGWFALASVPALATGYSDFTAGLYHLHEQDDLAVKYFTSALADPNLLPSLRPVALYDRAESYVGLKKYDLALADYTQSIALRPDFDAYFRRALLYEMLGKLDLASADFTSLGTLRPDLAMSFTVRGEFYLRQKSYDAAVADLKRAVQLDPEDGSILIRRSLAYRYKGDFSLALDDADEVLRLKQPKMLDAYLAKAAVYEEKHDFDRALNAIGEALQYSPKDPFVLLSRGVLEWEMKKYADAVKSLEAASGYDPSDTYAMVWLTIARHDAKDASDDLATRAARIDRKEWPSALIDLYLGKSSVDAVMTQARGDGLSAGGNLCEAKFYVAMWERMQGRVDGFKPALQPLPADCPVGYVEGRIAARLLEAEP